LLKAEAWQLAELSEPLARARRGPGRARAGVAIGHAAGLQEASSPAIAALLQREPVL
jgi:hypothetical protein